MIRSIVCMYVCVYIYIYIYTHISYMYIVSLCIFRDFVDAQAVHIETRLE